MMDHVTEAALTVTHGGPTGTHHQNQLLLEVDVRSLFQQSFAILLVELVDLVARIFCGVKLQFAVCKFCQVEKFTS